MTNSPKKTVGVGGQQMHQFEEVGLRKGKCFAESKTIRSKSIIHVLFVNRDYYLSICSNEVGECLSKNEPTGCFWSVPVVFSHISVLSNHAVKFQTNLQKATLHMHSDKTRLSSDTFCFFILQRNKILDWPSLSVRSGTVTPSVIALFWLVQTERKALV